MKIYRHESHHVIAVPYHHMGTPKLAVTIMGMFSFDTPSSLLKYRYLWKMIKANFKEMNQIDLCFPKCKAEYFVHGSCYAYDKKTKASFVEVTFADRVKTLLIYGDRYWVQGGLINSITEPEYFSSIPVTRANAFGGKNFPYNPEGKGYLSEINLPNIETPSERIRKISDTPFPALLSPFSPTCLSYVKKLGTYDENWLINRWPYYPDDIDWSYFNRAAKDQQYEGFFEGNESFTIINMHPEKKILQGNLPDIRMRCFIKKANNGNLLSELPLNLDTVWLLPTEEKGILIWHGQLESTEMSEWESASLYTIHELRSNIPKSIDYYSEYISSNKNSYLGQSQLKQAKNIFKNILSPELSPEANTVQNTLNTIDRKINEIKEKLYTVRSKIKFKENEETANIFNTLDFPDKLAAVNHFVDTLINSSEVIKEKLSPSRVNSTNKQLKQIDSIKNRIKICNYSEEIKVKELARWDAICDKIHEIDQVSHDIQNRSKKIQPSNYTRDDVIILHKAKEKLLNENLAGLDFSDLDLSGVNLEGCNLSQCLLKNTCLNGANLKNAIFINTDFANASFLNSNLEDALIQNSILENTNFKNANLKGAEISASKGKNLHFSNADLDGVIFTKNEIVNSEFEAVSFRFSQILECRFHDCHWNQVKMELVNANKCNFDKNHFLSINFDSASFDDSRLINCKGDRLYAKDLTLKNCTIESIELVHCEIRGSNIQFSTLRQGIVTQCILLSSSWFKTTLQKINFINSALDNLRINNESAMFNCDFINCSLNESALIESSYNDIEFKKCNMNDMQVMNCKWNQSRMNQCIAKRFRMINCRIQLGHYKDTNLFSAIFQGSNFHDSTFDNCNLYNTLLYKQNNGVSFLNCLHSEAHLIRSEL
ncbi:TPA: DUF2169 domain-containing protein [Legionella pneumophila]|nr:DUF2169 domain-containing protein [Legionella pneumophila]